MLCRAGISVDDDALRPELRERARGVGGGARPGRAERSGHTPVDGQNAVIERNAMALPAQPSADRLSATFVPAGGGDGGNGESTPDIGVNTPNTYGTVATRG